MATLRLSGGHRAAGPDRLRQSSSLPHRQENHDAPLRAAATRAPETARIANAAFPKGHPYLSAADEFGEMLTADAFAALFPRRGQPALAPWRLALATILQFAEGLSDRQAADAVRAARLEVRAAAGTGRRGFRRRGPVRVPGSPRRWRGEWLRFEAVLTPHRSPQPSLWAWGDDEWPRVRRLPPDAPREARPGAAKQPPLFDLEGLG